MGFGQQKGELRFLVIEYSQKIIIIMGNSINHKYFDAAISSNQLNSFEFIDQHCLVPNQIENDSNPLTTIINTGKLNTFTIASNNIMNSLRGRTNSIFTNSSDIPKICKMISIDDRILDDGKKYPEGLMKEKQNIGSWDLSIFGSKDKVLQQMQIQLSGYILTQRNIYKPIEVSQQKLIRIQKTDICKKYEMQQKIGEGGFGIVYKAKCLKSNELRAIKMIKIKQITQKRKKQMINQIEILIKMDHPNIIKVYEVIQYNHHYYIVTEYLKAGSIYTYLKTHKIKYTENIIKIIMKKILSAVFYIHSKNIIHRDLKLDNVVFQKYHFNQTEDIQLKIIDFGLAKQEITNIRRESRVRGTYTHLAPQNLDGYYSPKSDIWACGIIMHTLLRGTTPFRAKNKAGTLHNIKEDFINFKKTQWTDISRDAKDLIVRLLDKRSTNRLTASQALQHSWFKNNSQQQIHNSHLDQQILPKLYNFYVLFWLFQRGNNLISIIESILCFTKVSQTERQRIITDFNKIDKNGNGLIEMQQLKQSFINNSFDLNELEFEYIFNKLDKNNNKNVDLNQFICAVFDYKSHYKSAVIREIFDLFDLDGNGYIDRKQLQQVLKQCNVKQFQFIMKNLDQNSDDKISPEQFIDYVLNQKVIN